MNLKKLVQVFNKPQDPNPILCNIFSFGSTEELSTCGHKCRATNRQSNYTIDYTAHITYPCNFPVQKLTAMESKEPDSCQWQLCIPPKNPGSLHQQKLLNKLSCHTSPQEVYLHIYKQQAPPLQRIPTHYVLFQGFSVLRSNMFHVIRVCNRQF
jgi:hypothetical protein